MEPGLAALDRNLDFDTLRQRRPELRESLSALEQALAGPAPDRADLWARRVHVALVELAGDINAHVEVIEGADGLHPAVLASAPRLSHAVAALGREHDELRAQVDDLIAAADRVEGVADVADLRRRGTALLGKV